MRRRGEREREVGRTLGMAPGADGPVVATEDAREGPGSRSEKKNTRE
jgi:hypothetical protein